MANPETSLTQDLEAAAEKFEFNDEPDEVLTDEEPVEASNEESEEATPQAAQEEVPEETSAEAEQPDEPPEQQAEPDEPAAEAVEDKPPVGWTPAQKEVWKDVPPAAREAILKRDHEADLVLQRSTESRKLADEFVRTIEPYRALMAAEGVSDPFQAVKGLMEVTAQLKMGTPEQKAQRIAGLVNHYGVDIQALDSALAGQEMPPQVQQAQQQEFRDPRVDEMMWRQQQQVQQEAQTTIQQFAADPRNEFFEAVRLDMAARSDIAAAEGRNPPVEQLYEEAIWANPEIRTILLKRQEQQLHTPQNMMGDKQNAASSVKGTRASGGDANSTNDMSMRDVIASQFADDSRV